ncbi:alpha/beta hydrolase [Pantoea sp. 18069]|uniref:alpha/beta hydrolase n=1 Tax=Pantoea sp. 18069 TaxID=2681415 RepID=UPI001357803D|nr:alpha/beta hydrolase [Pantoea sp. 18069]
MSAPYSFAAAQAYYDRQYNARASVQDVPALIARYAGESQAAHALPGAVRDQAYGPGASDLLDIYPAAQPGAPVLFFIHGGYWRALSKNESAFMAPALNAAGATVVVPDYDLAPAASLDHIVDQMRRALAWTFAHIARWGGDPERICVSGSSAGGHLTGMLVAGGWQAAYGLRDTAVAAAAFPLSGLFDLQPLLHTEINGWMGLDDAAAQRNSPRFQLPSHLSHAHCALRVACGEFESLEFKRQSTEYLAAWKARCLPGQWVQAPGTNHFDLPLELGQAGSAVHRTALELLGLDAG